MTRRRFLGLAATGGVAASGLNGAVVEPRRVTVTRHRLGDPSSSPGPPLRMVQLSDLHLQDVDAHARRIAETVAELSPDMALFTGDTLDRAGKLDVLDAFLRRLPASLPKIAILGNWEHWGRVDVAALGRVFGAHNGRLLVNEAVRVEHHGRAVLVIGLDDAIGGRPDFARAVQDAPTCANRLLLAHCPVQRDRLALDGPPIPQGDRSPRDGAEPDPFRPHCILSGHTHGGQIALGRFAPMRPPGSGRYTSGWYRDEAPPMYVSRGLGTSVVPVRFGAPPEVAVFEWHLAAG